MSKKVKQISYLSAIVISVGSTVGAGIFFKNGEIFRNAGGSLGFMIASWLVAAIGILAIGLALIEVTSKSKGKGGVVDWVKRFLPQRFAKYSASYMLFVYIPLTYFAMPIYATMALQDAISVKFTGWEVMGISFAFFAWISFMGYYKIKAAEKMQWVFTGLKFLPLVIVPILSMIGIGQDGITASSEVATAGLTGISPWLGIVASIPAILFAVDGFYTISSMELKDEKKKGTAMAVSISVIIATYLFFSIFLGLNGDSDFTAVKIIKNNKWIGITINMIIVMAVLGIINGFAMAVPNIYHSYNQDKHTGVIEVLQRLFRIKKAENAAFAVSIIFSTLAFFILTPIAIYAWTPTAISDPHGYVVTYGYTSAALYELTDLVTNFTSLMLFVFIGMAILGALINRRTNKVSVNKKKYFIPAAVMAIAFMVIGVAYMIIANIYNISTFTGESQKTEIVKFTIFIVTTVGTLIPTYWDKIRPKRFNKIINS